MTAPRAALAAISSHLPETKLANDELARGHRDWSPDRLFAATGIRQRSLAAPDEPASHLGVCAAERLFASSRWRPENVDFLLYCTQSPDQLVPATACRIHERLRLRADCGALDVNQGCSGFVYALAVANGLVESRATRTVLLVTAETYSKFLPPDDIKGRAVFSDGAAATIVTAVDDGTPAMGPFLFGTDGAGAANLQVVAGSDGRTSSGHCLVMDGQRVFNFTIATVPALVRALLERADTTLDAVDYFVFHQANAFILNHLRECIGIPPGKFCLNLDTVGNTVSSTIPMALQSAMQQGRLHDGDRVMLVGFGAGYSWSGALLTWRGWPV